MGLTKELKHQGYDLIDGPIRNHKPLQLWLKKGFERIEFYYGNIKEAFKSDVVLNEVVAPSLNVNSTQKDQYAFNIGITVLENVLQSLGLGNLELSTKIKSGKSVTVSYDNAISKEIASGEIENYFSTADFNHENKPLLSNANLNNIIVITGVLFAKNLVVEIETTTNLEVGVVAKLKEVADGKLDFTLDNDTKLKMTSVGDSFFPIAVKASRVRYAKGIFKGLILSTDTHDWF